VLNSVQNRFWLHCSTLIVLAALVFAGALAAPQTQAPAEKVPREAARKPNPVKPTAESLARGKKLYGVDCALCHGDNGDGKGDMASDIKNITDFTNPDVQKNATDGAWFYVIRKGKGDMPPEESGRAKDDDVWSIVNYLRSFAKK